MIEKSKPQFVFGFSVRSRQFRDFEAVSLSDSLTVAGSNKARERGRKITVSQCKCWTGLKIESALQIFLEEGSVFNSFVWPQEDKQCVSARFMENNFARKF